jgi:AraC family transcriptional activator of pobA
LSNIREYHLHQNDYSKLHFEVKEAGSYFKKNYKHAVKAHRHSFYQVLWFKSAGSHYVDYEIVEHPENTIFFIKKKQIHYFCPESKNDGWLFHFNDSFINKFDGDAETKLNYLLFNEIGNAFINPSESELLKLEQLTQLISEEVQSKDYNYVQQSYYLFQAILNLIERIKRHQQAIDYTIDVDYEIAIQFKQLIDEHINENLGIDHFSGLLAISSKKLTSITKKYLHNTPAIVIHNRKILEAKRLLSNHTLSIKEVAYDLGFDQATYFTKYFKKYTGINPKEFQSQLP